MIGKIVEKKVIGIKQCLKHLKNDEGEVLYVAKDADVRLVSKLIQLAEEKNIKVVEIPTMIELGKMSGIDVKSAATLTLNN